LATFGTGTVRVLSSYVVYSTVLYRTCDETPEVELIISAKNQWHAITLYWNARTGSWIIYTSRDD